METKVKHETEERVDGRRAWRERNRNAVVDALLDLYEEGNLFPGAQEIAERSGVSRRSLFRYFDDMDDMCRVAIERHAERVGHLFELEGEGKGELPERIDRIVEQRVRLFERIARIRLLAKMRSAVQPILDERLMETQDRLRRQAEGHFAREMAGRTRKERRMLLAAVDTALSFEAYEHMSAMGASTAEIRDSMRLIVEALLTRDGA